MKDETYIKNIANIMIKPGKPLFELVVRAKVKQQEFCPAIEAMRMLLAMRVKCPVVRSELISDDERLEYFVLDLSGTSWSINDVVSRIKEGFKENLLDIRYHVPKHGGIVTEAMLFPPVLRIDGGLTRVAIMDMPSWKVFFLNLYDKLSSGALSLLWDNGIKIGEEIVKGLRRLGVTDRRILAELCISMMRSAGWGLARIKLMNISMARAQIVVEDSFECQVTKSIPGYVNSLMRGYINGVFNEIFGRKVNVVETSCIKRGGRVCVFEVKP